MLPLGKHRPLMLSREITWLYTRDLKVVGTFYMLLEQPLRKEMGNSKITSSYSYLPQILDMVTFGKMISLVILVSMLFLLVI